MTVLDPHTLVRPGQRHPIDWGFTGTRDGMTGFQESALHTEFANSGYPVVLHHGDCLGADEQAHRIARQHGFTIHLHPPVIGRSRAWCRGDLEAPPETYLERNRHIVDYVTRLYAAPKGREETHSGTWATIRYARKKGRHILIIWPDGKITEENP